MFWYSTIAEERLAIVLLPIVLVVNGIVCKVKFNLRPSILNMVIGSRRFQREIRKWNIHIDNVN